MHAVWYTLFLEVLTLKILQAILQTPFFSKTLKRQSQTHQNYCTNNVDLEVQRNLRKVKEKAWIEPLSENHKRIKSEFTFKYFQMVLSTKLWHNLQSQTPLREWIFEWKREKTWDTQREEGTEILFLFSAIKQ